MKKLLAIALTISAATALATEEVSTHEFCKSVSELAETIMARRQEGFSVVQMMETADMPLAQAIIKDAYSRPKFSSPKNQQRSISEFRDDYYIICLKAREK